MCFPPGRNNVAVHALTRMEAEDVRGRVVTESLVDLESLAQHRCRFEFRKGRWILSCEEAIQLAFVRNVGGSTQVPARDRNNLRTGQ